MKVVIRKVGTEFQVGTIICGLYNSIVASGTFAGAVRFAEDNGWRWQRYAQ